MSSPFEILGLHPMAGAEEIRAAYRQQVKECHPDKIQDPEARQAAQERMIQLNLAYEEAMKLISPRPQGVAAVELPLEDVLVQAKKLVEKRHPENALRILLRAETRDARWYEAEGTTLMMMEQYESAEQAFREAIRRDPENMDYRSKALEAAVAQRKAATLGGRLRKIWKNLRRG